MTYMTNDRDGISSFPSEFWYFQSFQIEFFSPVKIQLPSRALRQGVNRNKNQNLNFSHMTPNNICHNVKLISRCYILAYFYFSL